MTDAKSPLASLSTNAWYIAARPRSLTATYSPLLIGGAVAVGDHVFDLPRFLLALIGALLLQIGANLVNEYVDFKRGTDANKTDGMGMALSKTHLTPEQVRNGAVLSILGGILIGLYLMATSGPLLLLIGIGGVLMAIFYTAGPIPLAYIGLGELAVFIFMGPLMTLGTYYAVSGGLTSTAALLSGLPVAFTVANILHANNMRDYEADKAANKRTLAVRFGMSAARQEYAALTAGAYISALILIIVGLLPWPTLLIFGTIFEAIPLVRDAFKATDPSVLHRIQGRSAQLHFHVGLMIAAGWLFHAFIQQAANVIQTIK